MQDDNPWNYVTEFERELAKYTGAKFAITTDCATHAIELCIRYFNPKSNIVLKFPKHTYLSVPMLAKKLNLPLAFIDDQWEKYYKIDPFSIIDGSVHFDKNCYIPNTFYCVSFQHKKRLNLGRGGAILLDNEEAYNQLISMRYDGRNDMKNPWVDDNISTIGYHYYMTPEQAKIGLDYLKNNVLKPYELKTYKNYPDLTTFPVFKIYNENYVQHNGYHDYLYVWEPKLNKLTEVYVDQNETKINNEYNLIINREGPDPHIYNMLAYFHKKFYHIVENFTDDTYFFSINYNNYYNFLDISKLFPNLKSIKIFELEVLWTKEYDQSSTEENVKSVRDWFVENDVNNIKFTNIDNINNFAIKNNIDVTYCICEHGIEKLNKKYIDNLKIKIKHFNFFLLSQILDYINFSKNSEKYNYLLEDKSLLDKFHKILNNKNKNKILNLNRRADWHRHLIAQSMLGLFENKNERIKISWLSDFKAYYDHPMNNGKSDFINFENIFLKLLSHEEKEIFDSGGKLLKDQNLKLDTDKLHHQFFYRFFDVIQNYNDVGLEIVSETLYFGPLGDISEKSLRPILLKTPFIIMGGPGSWKTLEKLGFKNYNHFFDINDDEPNALIRFNKFFNFIKKLSTISDNDYENYMIDLDLKCKSITEYNYANLYSEQALRNYKTWITEIHQ